MLQEVPKATARVDNMGAAAPKFDAIDNLKRTVLPDALEGTDATASIDETTGSSLDMTNRIDDTIVSYFILKSRPIRRGSKATMGDKPARLNGSRPAKPEPRG